MLTDLSFTVAEVEHALRRLDTQKAPGPDGLHPVMLKSLAVELAPVVYRLFRLSLDTATLPLD